MGPVSLYRQRASRAHITDDPAIRPFFSAVTDAPDRGAQA
jgi:hypothetical protein